ncbi:hypothetical protein F5883DRAFT_376670, partial [Diaporthe sp. PMI_573]
VHYIASLSNTKSDDEDNLIYTPTPQREVDTMNLMENHLGVPRILISHSREKLMVAKRPNIWWRSFKI